MQRFCVRIVTGAGTYNNGTLEVSVNNDRQVQPGMFEHLETVMDYCFLSLDSITLKNPTDDAWAGVITVTKDGVQTTLKCITCTGESFKGTLAVDGNQDGYYAANAYCLNGKPCTLALAGKRNAPFEKGRH